MSRSFDHGVRAMAPSECDHFRRSAEQGYRRACASGKCQNDPTHVASYRYVTGRAGRVSTSERYVCAEHAIKFAQKHGLDLPMIGEPGPEPGPRIADELFRGMRESFERDSE